MADVNVNFVLGNDEPIRADFQLEPDVTYTAEIVTSTMSGNHPELRGRDLPDQHPMSAVTGLEDALDGLSDDITAENNRAVEAEETLDNKIDSEADTRADEITRVEGLISDEETRAEGVEGGLREDLTAEVSRATNAESVLQTNITAETNRATSAEDTLQANITAEENRAKGVETSLQANITAEENRAKGVEQQLTSSIDSNHQAISNHVSDKNNPHEVTKAQVGLGNVENLAPADMPMSTATKTYVDNADNGLQGQITTINTTIGGYGNIVTHNVSEFATASQGDLADTALQPNDNISELTNNLSYQTATQVANSIAVETNNRELADNNLQSQIDAIVSASDVFDIVGTYAELQAYDISTVPVNDIIKVLEDSTHGGAATYYRCIETNNVKSWSYIGSEGAYYTKGEADSKFVPQTRTVNNKALSSDITLTASDVGALPSSTVIPTVNDATVTIQKNGSTVSTFTLNQSSNETVNITVPTTTSELTNDSGFITSSSLPTVNDGQLDIQVNGSSIATFTANQSGNTTANIVVGNGLPDQTGNAGKVLSTDGTDASWEYKFINKGNYNNNVQYYPGDIVQYYYKGAYHKYLCKQPTLGFYPSDNLNDYWLDLRGYTRLNQYSGDYYLLPYTPDGWGGNAVAGVNLIVPQNQTLMANQPTVNTYSGLLKVPGGIDGYYTSAQVDALIPTVNDSTITFTQGGVNKGSFTLNQSSGATIALDAGGAGGIQNTATGTDSLTILGNPASDDFFINIGSGSGINVTATEEEILCPASIAIGIQDNSLGGAEVGGEHAIAIGTGTNAEENGIAIGYASQSGTIGVAVGVSSSASNNGVAVGGGANASGASAVAIGTSSNALSTNSISIGNNSLSQVNRYATNGIGINGKVTGTPRASANNSIGIGGNVTNVQNAIQLGSGTNTTANSLQVGSYQLLDTSTGLIPDARISTNIARTSNIPTVDQTYNSSSTNAQSGTAVAGLLEAIYPVGSVYIGTQATCPMSTVMSGTTWTLVSSGKALWTGDGTNGNTTINAGLPNITGSIAMYDIAQAQSVANGAFTLDTTAGNGDYTGTNSYTRKHFKANFSASSSNSIYGNSTTVQPPAYVVNVWRRTA